jgi:tRNA pseudouridine55 synthase
VSIDGILNILKPSGKTSFGVVSLIRRLSGERRVGHTGTLDPEATGVLVVCLGQGTRIAEFLVHDTKVYRAEIELGVTTDTYDTSGKVIQRSDPSFVTKEQLEEVLDSFHGNIEQIPPMYSALRYKGKRLYQLARVGIEVARKPRKVHISRLELLEWQPPAATIEVECSTGTYIRSLAQDTGTILGCGACLRKLVRLKCGLFDIDEAMDIASMEEAFHYGYWQRFLYPIDEVLLDWRAAIVNQESESAIRKGRSVSLVADENLCTYPYSENQCRAYSGDGHFVAVLRLQPEGKMWHPEKVFSHRS